MCTYVSQPNLILTQQLPSIHSLHSDLKIPSEHTVCGKVFPAELSIFMLHPLEKTDHRHEHSHGL
jgi:hypothetical protein